MQAASPAIEINRLFSLMDTGEKMLRVLAIAIILVSGLSVFISLFSKMRSRRYELAFMRVKGATRGQLFMMIILEGLIIASLGTLIGLLLAHLSMYFLSGTMEANYRYTFTAFEFLISELWVILVALLIGVVASVIPAMQAANTDISDTLAK
jgi:putative ABC transport system permease protein